MGSRIIAARYELGHVLGRGGMGEVYEAIDKVTGGEVAVKVMRLRDGHEATEGSEETEREWEVRFEREVRAIEVLHSPHIVRILDAGTDEASNERFLVMERLKGMDLAALLKRLGPLPPQLVLRLAAQVLLGLEKAHAGGIVHRDIKPGNLFLTRDGHRHVVRILDFGIARLGIGNEDSDLTELTRTGSMLGSPHYMAPEQVRGAKRVDERADLWSVGVVMYRLLTGKLPHDSDDGVGGLFVTICTTPATPIQSKAPWIRPELAQIVHRALELSKTARFQTAREMYDVIMALLPSSGADVDDEMLVALTSLEKDIVAPPASLPSASSMSVSVVSDSQAAVTARTLAEGPAIGKRSFLLAMIGGVFAAVVLAVGAVMLILGLQKPPVAPVTARPVTPEAATPTASAPPSTVPPTALASTTAPSPSSPSPSSAIPAKRGNPSNPNPAKKPEGAPKPAETASSSGMHTTFE